MSTATLSAAARALLEAIRADQPRPLRAAMVTGPGRAYRNFVRWSKGIDDPSIPTVGYSHQIYEVIEALGGSLLTILTAEEDEIASTDRFVFLHVEKNRARGAAFHLQEVQTLIWEIWRAHQFGAEVFICQRMSAHFWVISLARLLGMRVVVSLHNTFWPMGRAPKGRDRMLNRLNGWFWRTCVSGTLCASPEIARQLEQISNGRARNVHVHMPQYPDALKARPLAENGIKDSTFRIAYLGRVELYKGVFLLLQSFEKLVKMHPEARLSYAGEGSALESLRDRVAESSAASQVEVLGRIEGSTVFDYLSNSDVLVCPTTTGFAEGLAQTPIEAAISGIPSIVSDVVPAAEVLGEATLTVRADSARDLTLALEDLAESPEIRARMREAGLALRKVVLDRNRSSASCLALILHDTLGAARNRPD